MLASLSNSTYKQYDGCIKNWINYCNKYSYDYTRVSVPTVIHFLTEIFDKGAKYGTINSYKSALALLLGSMLDDDRIKRFMKGVFKLRPTKAKYNLTWDPNIVLNYLSQQWPNEDLSLEALSKKTVTLLALVTAHRVQTLSLIKTNNIQIQSTFILIKVPDLIKTSKPNSYQPVLRLPYFNERPQICPARCLEAYINKTQTLHKHGFLFINCKQPHHKITPQTISRWIKDTLRRSGVDTSIWSAHSTRHASTSTASRLGVSIDTIRNTAGWSQSSSVFARFYNKEVITYVDQFARSILSSDCVL